VEGTVVTGGFNESIIKGGISSWLRLEFRELEILDDITKMKVGGILHPSVYGENRTILIKNFKMWKGRDCRPQNMHQSLYIRDKDIPKGDYDIMNKNINQVKDMIKLKKKTERKIKRTKNTLANNNTYNITKLWIHMGKQLLCI